MSLICNAEYFDLGHYLKALLGINTGDVTSVRFMQVESVGDYFNCTQDKDIDTFDALFRLLIDTNMCDHPVIRVDIGTDDGLCLNFLDCNQKELEPLEAFKSAIGVGADGQPVL